MLIMDQIWPACVLLIACDFGKFKFAMRCYLEGQAWCSGESCLTESPGHGFEAASPQILRGEGLPWFFPSPDPTHVAASGTGSALPWELSSLLVCLNFWPAAYLYMPTAPACVRVYSQKIYRAMLFYFHAYDWDHVSYGFTAHWLFSKKYIEPCFSFSMHHSFV